ncbi:MAG: hypothetical protein ACR2I4_08550, partial [Actinomycetota bacterium]
MSAMVAIEGILDRAVKRLAYRFSGDVGREAKGASLHLRLRQRPPLLMLTPPVAGHSRRLV